jgi:hypothetical protein
MFGAAHARPKARLQRTSFAAALFAAALAVSFAPVACADEAPGAAHEPSPSGRISPMVAAGVWTFVQLIPSPMLVASSDRVGAGVRWQLTPLLYSFGVAAKPFRSFIVEPVARHSGAIELFFSPEWACCAKGDRTSWIARGGVRVYVPIIGKGEDLTASLGGSYYRAGDRDGASFEVGVHTLFSSIGLTVTFSPGLTGREVMTALQLRYF